MHAVNAKIVSLVINKVKGRGHLCEKFELSRSKILNNLMSDAVVLLYNLKSIGIYV